MLQDILEDLYGRGSVALERGEYSFDYYRCGIDIWCFKKERDTIKRNGRLACRVLMMVYKTDGTIVIGRCVIMVMEYRHECG
jgi:hypothetical protein